MESWVSPDCPPQIVDQFWRHVRAFESTADSIPFDLLTRKGVELLPPDMIEEARLAGTLWDVIRGMASLGLYLLYTDHLDDRELYTRLWKDLLRQPVKLLPGGVWHIDLVGTGSHEDLHDYFRYYAEEEERLSWMEEFPDFVMPESEPRPRRRDHRLPRPDDMPRDSGLH